MAINNETVADIGEQMRKVDPTAFVVWWDQVAAAHKREIAAKDDERLTIVANYENVIKDLVRNISAKDAEIENLKKKIDEYERQPELMAETAREALRTLQEQDAEIAELKDCILKEIDWLKRMIKDDLEGWATSMWSPSDEFRKHTFSRLIEDNTYHIERMKKALEGGKDEVHQ